MAWPCCDLVFLSASAGWRGKQETSHAWPLAYIISTTNIFFGKEKDFGGERNDMAGQDIDRRGFLHAIGCQLISTKDLTAGRR